MSVSPVFIANRGEIAVRIVRACRKLGLGCVVGASEVDMDGLAAELADRVVGIGPGRIQVEHPVTEAVTGADLVAEQFAIADGRPLSIAQHEHAVEARLSAEDVANGFAPSPGRLTRFALPALPGRRVDTHCRDGALIPPCYDSLMAKLIGHGESREEAVGVLLEALVGLEVEGVETNRSLLVSVLAHEDFAGGAVTTRWLEQGIAA
jgi:acetyl-CoA carboxylase biotin carboxylase subunit